jgi:hypothetical protein
MTNRRVQFAEEPSVQVYEDDLSRDKRKQLRWCATSRNWKIAGSMCDSPLNCSLTSRASFLTASTGAASEVLKSVEVSRCKGSRSDAWWKNSALLRQVEHRSQTEKACPAKMTHDLAALSRKLSKPSTLLAQVHAAKHFGGDNDGKLEVAVCAK